ncbi:hypothetical protein WBP07_31460 [Novosphingobium sp. BL-8A]|uniref:hypothetical protein n=1 Tax=Novosphingobium sp. BL-8A TaxID=3127639 RepID=UPI003757995F
MTKARLRMGMVGRSPGFLMSPMHRIAAEIDHETELAAAVFCRDGEPALAARLMAIGA